MGKHTDIPPKFILVQDYVRTPDHITQISNAINLDKIPVMGYTPWAPIDLVSLATGEMTKRYGFVYTDMDNEGKGTKKRIKKASFDWYKKVIATNGEDLSY